MAKKLIKKIIKKISPIWKGNQFTVMGGGNPTNEMLRKGQEDAEYLFRTELEKYNKKKNILKKELQPLAELRMQLNKRDAELTNSIDERQKIIDELKKKIETRKKKKLLGE